MQRLDTIHTRSQAYMALDNDRAIRIVFDAGQQLLPGISNLIDDGHVTLLNHHVHRLATACEGVIGSPITVTFTPTMSFDPNIFAERLAGARATIELVDRPS